MAKRQYWLVKSEEDVYPIRKLQEDGRTPWDGIRNYEARNFMRDGMKTGDLVLFYHSNANPPGVAGVARVASEPYPDALQFDPKSPYFDEKADPENPRWILVDLEYVETFPRFVSLNELRQDPRLAEMALFTRKRLSVQPVAEEEFEVVQELASGGD